MLTGMLWMAMGIASVAWWPRLPSFTVLTGIFIASLAVGLWLRFRRSSSSRSIQSLCIAFVATALGIVWGCGYGYYIRCGLLSPEIEQQSLLLSGRIDGLVELREGFSRNGEAAKPALHFQFAVDTASAISISAHQTLLPTLQLPRLIQLNWYDVENIPQAGEYWQLRVKLKRPRGFANPGGFDYAAWLVANRIGATGYVEHSSDNKKLIDATWWSVDALRGRAQNYLQQRLHAFAHCDLLLGLLIGDGGAISTAEWDAFRATGTVHLFVVSGLQIAFTGGLALWFARLWWRSQWCESRRRNYLLGVIPALFIAIIYAVLAGWGVPIQRALIMFAVIVWALIARRQIHASTGWITALWLALLFDPLAVRDIGFWFSFIAVAAILLVICGHRSASPSSFLQKARRWWRVQWALFVTSLPLLLVLSGQLTLLALPANFIAIPLSTFISLPLAFAGLIADSFSQNVGEIFWRYADTSLDWLWRYLLWLEQHSANMIWHPRGINAWICLGTALAAILWLLPRGIALRLFAPIFFLPLWAPPLDTVAAGDCTVTVIDVGQGLSVLIKTARHTLLYDTGPPFGPERTVADLTVIPTLRQLGVASLDTVMISHNDSDHAGGWPAVAREFSVNRVMTGEEISHAENTAPRTAEFCRAGMHWRWDDINFDVLYPSQDIVSRNQLSANNHSCVLQISAGDAHVLLTGDIERDAETVLLDNPALQRATLLLAPHHGSHSSSTMTFIERVHPEYVVFSTGYLNRFKHPHTDVVERYRQSGAELFDTAVTGALSFNLMHGHVAQISLYRLQNPHYWD